MTEKAYVSAPAEDKDFAKIEMYKDATKRLFESPDEICILIVPAFFFF